MQSAVSDHDTRNLMLYHPGELITGFALSTFSLRSVLSEEQLLGEEDLINNWQASGDTFLIF